jgi:hypothetical protein
MGSTYEELIFRFSGDSTGVVAAVKETQSAFGGLTKGAVDTGTAHAELGTKVDGVLGKLATEKLSVDGLTTSLQEHTGMSHDAAAAVGEMVGALGPMGVVAAGAAVGVLAVGAAAFGLMQHAANSAHELEHLSASSGIGVEGLSAMRYAANVLGEDLTSLTNASFMLQKQLGQDAVKAKEGAELLGLSYRDLKAAKPEEALLMVSDALRACQDEQVRAAAGADLMSRGYKESAYLMQQDLRALTEDAQKTGNTLSTEDVKAAHDFEIALNGLKVGIEAATTKLGAFLIESTQGAQKMGVWTSILGAMNAYWTGGALGLTAYQEGLAAVARVGGTAIPKLAQDIDLLSPAQERARMTAAALAIAHQSVIDHLKTLDPAVSQAAVTMFAAGKSVADVAKEFAASKIPIDATEAQLTALHESWQKNTTAAKDHAAALKEIASAQIPLTAAQADQLAVDLKLHLSEDLIAKDIGATVTQVRLAIDASKDKQKELAKEAETEQRVRKQALEQMIAEGKTRNELGVDAMKRVTDSYQEKRRLEDEYDDLIAKSTQTQYEYEVGRIQREAEARARDAKQRGGDVAGALNDINKITEEKLHELQVQWGLVTDAIRIDWLAVVKNIGDSIGSGFAAAIVHVKSWKDAGLDILRSFQQEAEKIFSRVFQSLVDRLLGPALRALSGGSGNSGGLNLRALLGLGGGGGGNGEPSVAAGNLPGFTSAGTEIPSVGGSNSSGSTAAAGMMAVGGAMSEYAALSNIYQSGTTTAGRLASVASGAMTGAAIGSIVPGLGTAAGAGIGALAGLVATFFSESKAYKDWKSAQTAANEQFASLKQSLMQTYGSMQAIAEAGRQVGIDLAGALSLGGAGGPGSVGLKQLQDTIAQFEKLKALASQYQLTWQDLSKDAMTQWGQASIQQLTNDRAALEQQGYSSDAILGKMAGGYNDILKAYLTTGEKLPDVLGQSVEKLAQMGLLTDENKNKLLGLTAAAAAPDFATVQAIVQKYGMDTSKLGKSYAQMEGTATGGQLVKDVGTMTAAGMDQWQVVAGMNPQISALVEQALKYGTALPAELKPIVETMAKWGPEMLVDSKGNAMRDLDALKFADPVVDATVTATEQLKAALITELEKLIAHVDAAATGSSGAIVAGPEVGGPAGAVYARDAPTGAVNGPGYTEGADAIGSVGLREGTGGQFWDFGAGTPAILHGLEAVIPLAQAARIAALPSPASSMQDSLVASVGSGAADRGVDQAAIIAGLARVEAAIRDKDLSVQIQQAPGSLDTLARKMMGSITRTILRNDSTDLGAGARTVLREALGVR